MAPAFSIVIPTCGRATSLAACLESLGQLAYPDEGFEILVVDDGSGVPLEPVLAKARERCALTLVEQPRRGPAAARNAGAARARGRLLAFTDDDCIVDPGWLSAFAARLDGAPDGLVGGKTRNGVPENACSSASQALVDYLHAYYNADPDRPRFFASNNIAVHAERFRQAGGFDEGFSLAAGEDRELCDRWLRLGGRLLFAPGATVSHRHPLTLGAFLRQQFNYGRGTRKFRELRAKRRGEPMRLEPLAFYTGLLAHVTRAKGRASPGLATLAVLSQAANAAGFLRGGPAGMPAPPLPEDRWPT